MTIWIIKRLDHPAPNQLDPEVYQPECGYITDLKDAGTLLTNYFGGINYRWKDLVMGREKEGEIPVTVQVTYTRFEEQWSEYTRLVLQKITPA